MLIIRRRGRVLAEGVASDPFGFSIYVMLLLPDGCPYFELFDHVAGRPIRLVTMPRGDRDSDTDLADRQTPGAVDETDPQVLAPPPPSLGAESLKNSLSQRLKRVVGHVHHFSSEIDIPDEAEENRLGPV
jgi:hypothetical protein